MRNSNLPIYPAPSSENTGSPYYNVIPHTGLTKREHFAGLAMQGLLNSGFGSGGMDGWEQRLSRKAATIADALLKELDK